MKKAVVTGGAGFIGSHLTEDLLTKGYHVTVIDTLSSQCARNLKDVISNTNLEYICGNTGNPALLQETLSGVDYVFHHAAVPKPSAVSDLVDYYMANTNEILNVLQTALENKVKKVIFASSCAVYGNEPTVPKREDMMPSPESPYALAKLIGEQYCQIYTRTYGLSTVCLRYFNVYGPRQNPDSPLASVIPKFIRNIKSGKPQIGRASCRERV